MMRGTSFLAVALLLSHLVVTHSAVHVRTFSGISKYAAKGLVRSSTYAELM